MQNLAAGMTRSVTYTAIRATVGSDPVTVLPCVGDDNHDLLSLHVKYMIITSIQLIFASMP